MRKLLVMLFVATIAFAGAARGQFCPGVAPWVFTDVPASDTFCGYITRMAVDGITTGCQIIDANNRLFCPDDLVTRKQMSAFMIRLADALFPLTCAAGQVMKWDGLDWTCANDATVGGGSNAYVFGGNAFGATAVLGTTDDNALDVRVNNSRVMRYEPNAVSPNVIGGSPANNVTAGVRGATIAGGGTSGAPNRVTDEYGTVGGGYGNRAGDNSGTTIDHGFATVGGGTRNTASGWNTTVSGGTGNTATGYAGTVAGGDSNLAYGYNSFVGGGLRNFAVGNWSAVGGGEDNEARQNSSTVGGGASNLASGFASTVPGGYINLAQGRHSFAAGVRAKALHDNTFVWGGSDTIDTNSISAGEFVVYAPTAIRMLAGAPGSGGCMLTSGAGWACASDRTIKSDIVAIDQGAILDQVMSLPIAKWSLTSQPGVRHVGPMAQDFHKAFGLGTDDTTITTVDVQGVALAAIQGLNAKLEAKVAAKDAEIAALKREMADLRLAVELLMARMSTDGRVAQTR